MMLACVVIAYLYYMRQKGMAAIWAAWRGEEGETISPSDCMGMKVTCKVENICKASASICYAVK